MQRIHFFYSIQVGVQENLRYLGAVIAVIGVIFPFTSSLYSALLLLTYVSKRVSSIQLVVTWCTLQQHLSMHLTTSRPTFSGMLESLSSIFLFFLSFKCS